ncbi:HU family DNA-binding protein [Lutibacter sp.]|uniref:HU family DNA-binding protein n=1 Tax=Lutibacter sp. TaxID=1925666 RepID=UPI001A303A31|nr:HU family DNA-binding protein [Lutibacter sp.]MBI9040118.1 DNA-binding protein [Lutibacter sp.]
MALNYRITKRRNNIKDSDEPQYIMQAVSKGIIDLDKICYDISQQCTLTESDVVGVVKALGNKLQDSLEQGYIVDMGDIGRFKLGFKGTAQPDPKLLSKQSIQKFILNYQPSKRMKLWLKKNVTILQE